MPRKIEFIATVDGTDTNGRTLVLDRLDVRSRFDRALRDGHRGSIVGDVLALRFERRAGRGVLAGSGELHEGPRADAVWATLRRTGGVSVGGETDSAAERLTEVVITEHPACPGAVVERAWVDDTGRWGDMRRVWECPRGCWTTIEPKRPCEGGHGPYTLVRSGGGARSAAPALDPVIARERQRAESEHAQRRLWQVLEKLQSQVPRGAGAGGLHWVRIDGLPAELSVWPVDAASYVRRLLCRMSSPTAGRGR